MHRTLIVVAAVGGLAMAALPIQVMAQAQGTKTMKADDKGGTKYPGSANGGIWKNKDDGKPAGRKLRPGGGYDIGPNKKL